MAKREAFQINGSSIAPGTRQTVDIPVSTLSDHTPVHLSVHVVHGKKPGPVLFVSAAIHGDEVIGAEIVRRLLKAAPLKNMTGTLLAVPIVNAFGFHNHSRYLPDRRDLNRCFPGLSEGSMASRLAHIFMREVVNRADMGIDLHSAAVQRTNLPQIRLTAGNERLMELGRVFGAPVMMQSNLRDGSLRMAAEEAETLGLLADVVGVDQVVDRAIELAEPLTDGPTAAYVETRRLLVEASHDAPGPALSREQEVQGRLGNAPGHLEGLKAFLEKRAPDFRATD